MYISVAHCSFSNRVYTALNLSLWNEYYLKISLGTYLYRKLNIFNKYSLNDIYLHII